MRIREAHLQPIHSSRDSPFVRGPVFSESLRGVVLKDRSLPVPDREGSHSREIRIDLAWCWRSLRGR
jgi:hypothetical protein